MNDEQLVKDERVQKIIDSVNHYETVLTHLMPQAVDNTILSSKFNSRLANLIGGNTEDAKDELKNLVGSVLFSTFYLASKTGTLDKYGFLNYLQDENTPLDIFKIETTIRAKDFIVQEFMGVYERKMIAGK